jgi:hypothetical protein
MRVVICSVLADNPEIVRECGQAERLRKPMSLSTYMAVIKSAVDEVGQGSE